jgi:hypothetical protein
MEQRQFLWKMATFGRRFVLATAIVGAMTLFAGAASATSDASDLPSTWHVHDGQGATLGPQHKGIGFFPTILGLSVSDYLLDPAECPNATDKAFLPSFGSSEAALLRAGQCQTSSAVISLRTVPVGTSGPEDWGSLTTASEPGWVTYYRVTPR